jgi:hypothetical protein
VPHLDRAANLWKGKMKDQKGVRSAFKSWNLINYLGNLLGIGRKRSSSKSTLKKKMTNNFVPSNTRPLPGFRIDRTTNP